MPLKNDRISFRVSSNEKQDVLEVVSKLKFEGLREYFMILHNEHGRKLLELTKVKRARYVMLWREILDTEMIKRSPVYRKIIDEEIWGDA